MMLDRVMDVVVPLLCVGFFSLLGFAVLFVLANVLAGWVRDDEG